MRPTGARTQSIGKRTQSLNRRRLDLNGMDPSKDYCFRRKVAINEGGGIDRYGYIPTDVVKSGIKWNGILGKHYQKHTKSKNTLEWDDVILCERPKEVTAEFKAYEDQKYNAQVSLVKNVSKAAKMNFRQAAAHVGQDEDTVTVKGGVNSKLRKRRSTHKQGITEE